MTGTRYTLEVRPRIPEPLARLEELANDLLYSWDRQVRGLFYRLDHELWEACRHSPKVFLRRVSQQRLEEALDNRVFMEEYNRALSGYDTYHQAPPLAEIEDHLHPERDLVAYFCAEFGLHESLPIYSGGLGILAGDHCKAASDLSLPFVAVGMLYPQGYFTQTIDGHGNQVAEYGPNDFAHLPLSPALDSDGKEVHIAIELPGRNLTLKVWRATAGRIRIYLLDSDLPENAEADRAITHQLYGGDTNTRIQQEIVLGIGGVRALRALGLRPTVWHINEGHAAFQILERCRELVDKGMDFDGALELVAAGTVFTTHTPVPAGHDIFDHNLVATYFDTFARRLGIGMEEFAQFGSNPGNHGGFNMTALALRGSRFHNGVSRIHGGVASRMEAYVWPQVPHEENPIRYVTNGVHVPTFLAREWVTLFNMHFGSEWRNELRNGEYWSRVDEIPTQTFWSLRQTLKSELFKDVRRRTLLQHRRNGSSEAEIQRLTRFLDPQDTDVLVLGFARRFATYKRATLLFSEPDRLARLLTDEKRPVVLVFAGKAHPHDLPGQHLIQVIHEYSRRPEFEGHIILLEGYDLALGRKLVTGVDVWINTPEYPLEASGTSGQKAGVNGVMNLSVLDGWWGEGYEGDNGWAIAPHGPQFDAGYRNREEADDLLNIIEHEVIPLYYERGGHGLPEPWVNMSKAAMRSSIPRFNSQRMVMDYVEGFYGPANLQAKRLADDGGAPAVNLAKWKRKISDNWPKVAVRRLDHVTEELIAGDSLPIRVAARLADLVPEDVTVECLVGTESEEQKFVVQERFTLEPKGTNAEGETLFQLDLEPSLPGLQYYKLRMYPSHELMTHPFETGCMVWV